MWLIEARAGWLVLFLHYLISLQYCFFIFWYGEWWSIIRSTITVDEYLYLFRYFCINVQTVFTYVYVYWLYLYIPLHTFTYLYIRPLCCISYITYFILHTSYEIIPNLSQAQKPEERKRPKKKTENNSSINSIFLHNYLSFFKRKLFQKVWDEQKYHHNLYIFTNNLTSEVCQWWWREKKHIDSIAIAIWLLKIKKKLKIGSHLVNMLRTVKWRSPDFNLNP